MKLRISSPVSVAEKSKKTPDHYEVSNALETITKAHEHLADAHMMKHVHALISKKKKSFASIGDLKAHRSALAMESAQSEGGETGNETGNELQISVKKGSKNE